MKAIRVSQPGGPEALEYVDCPDPTAGPGEAVVKLEVVGVNFADTLQRQASYPGGASNLPMTPGLEAAGVVTAIGDGVSDVRVGERVVVAGAPGSYAEQMAAPTHRLIPLPAGIDAKSAVAATMQGRTAHYLVYDAYPVQAGDRVLVHAGAGGVGMFLIQLAKRLGAEVFTTVSTPEKARFAAEMGADTVINYTQQDFADVVMDATNGEGVQAVYDAVGKTTFEGSLRCVGVRGHLLMYGQSSGRPPPIDLHAVQPRRSLYVSYHSGADYRRTREELIARAHDLYRWIREGELRVHIHKEYPLADAAAAHRDIQSRGTIGKLLLIP
jgi:NADPH:quinone reductase